MKVKLLSEKAIVPTKGSDDAAGFDLYANPDNGSKMIAAGKTEKIRTGIAVEIPNGFFGAIFARSGLATSRGLRPANCVGVVDSDYRGEVIVALHNDSDENQMIYAGDRVAQLVLIPYGVDSIEIVDDLGGTKRGSGGFGSTGIK